MLNAASTFWAWMERHAAECPDKTAIATLDQPPLTYRKLFAAAAELRQELLDAGIGADQRVALVVPDGVQMLYGMVAVGATTQTILTPATMAENEFAELLRRASCDLAIIHEDSPAQFHRAAIACKVPVWIVRHATGAATGHWRAIDAAKVQSDTPARIPGIDDIAIVLSSSGTTGRAKIVPRTHRNVCHFADAIIRDLNLTPDDVTIIATPNHLSMGSQATGLLSLRMGGLAVCNDGPYEPSNYLGLFERFKPTFMTASPVYFRSILAAIDAKTPPVDVSSVRAIRVSSDLMPDDIRHALERKFGVSIDSSYSSSEALSIAVRTTADNDRPPTYLGHITSGSVRILDDDGNQVPQSEVGEIAVSDPAVSPCYIDDEELTARAFKDGCYRMGDLGFIDADGGLHFVSRKADIINRGGYKIAPSEVERALGDHPAIAQCSVFGVPHRRLGEDIAVAVVPKPGHTFDEAMMRQHLASRLGPGKWPRRLVLIDDLPRNTVGKVLRRELTARFGDEAAQLNAGQGQAAWTSPEVSMVAGLWAYILEVPTVAADTSFIEAGGDSLQAGILQAETAAWFDLRLEPDFILSPDCTPLAIANRLQAGHAAA